MASCDDETYMSLNRSDISFIEPIGKGSFGTVFKVKLKTSDGQLKEAAAKTIGSSKQSDDELMFMSKLKHKNVIDFYGFIRERTELTIVTELASKGDLQRYLQNSDTPLPIELVKKWTKEAAEGICYLHQQRTVHKDIKSSNFLITSEDTLKLCDFGTVGVLDNVTEKTDHRKGTVRWMAPEVIEKEIRSFKSDVYSYGIVTWEICSRAIPFAELKTKAEIMDAIVEGKRPKIPDGCPVVLRKIMHGCWREDHVGRPTMEEVLDMLNSEQDDECEGDQRLTEDSEDEDNPDRYEYFENFVGAMLKTTRRDHEKRQEGEDLNKKAQAAFQTFQRLQTKQAETSKQSVEEMVKSTKTDRRQFLEDKQAEMIAKKEKMKREFRNTKPTITSEDELMQFAEMASIQVGQFARQQAEQMFQACYKSEDWDDEDLKSFTRMSIMHANIPDVIQEVEGQVKICSQSETTCDVFELSSIPSKDILLQWRGILETDPKEGEYRYIETESGGMLGLDTIEKLLVIHRALGIKSQVKQDLIWSLSPPMKPTQMEKRPGSLTAFQNLVFHEKCDQILGGYGLVSEQIATVCCDQALSVPVIQWFVTRLNQMQSDVFCICPQAQDDTQQALCDLLEDGNQKPTALVFILNVTRSGEGVALRDQSEPGSHFSLCYVNTLTSTVLYADSLGWPIPKELHETVSFYFQCIYEYSMPDLEVLYCHAPSSVTDDHTHKCCQKCVTYYPLQTCQTICGPVVIIAASIACLDNNLFLFLTTHQRYNNYPLIRYLHTPTEYSKYLHYVLATWLGDQWIDVDFVTPKNFRKYQLVASFDPDIVADLDFALFQQFIVPVPGLIEVLLPEGSGTTQTVDADVATNEGIPTSTTRWIGPGSDVFTEETIRSYPRITTTRSHIPQIADIKEKSFVTDAALKHTTNVFLQSQIPDKTTLHRWHNQIDEMMNNTTAECHAYLETGEQKYDKAALFNALQLHNVRQIGMEVNEELTWFASYQAKPLAMTKLPSSKSITKFRNLCHTNTDDDMLPDYNMNARDLAKICCNRKISGKHIEWIVKELNSMQSKVICVYKGSKKSTKPYLEEKLDKPQTAIAIIFNVVRSDRVTHFSDQLNQESHCAICFVDIETNKIIYGDSLGWPAPDDLKDAVSDEYQSIFRSPLPSMEIVVCHDTTFNTSCGEHICSAMCATYYPLQTCNTVSGVVCSVMMAIACLAPEYLKFLTVAQYNKIFTGSLAFHIQCPTLHSNYLRRVLATWFADTCIDIQHVVPEGFDSYKQLAVPGIQVAGVYDQ